MFFRTGVWSLRAPLLLQEPTSTVQLGSPAPLAWLSTCVLEMKERVSEVSRRTVNVLKDTRNAVTMSFHRMLLCIVFIALCSKK